MTDYTLKAETGIHSVTGKPVKLLTIKIRLRDARFTEKAFKPYALGIGQAALAWNTLHERLGFLFCALLGHSDDQYGFGYASDRSVGLWNSAVYDRPKRDLLKSVVQAMSEEDRKKHPERYAGLTWLLIEAEKLEQVRNNAIHAPLSLPFSAATAKRMGVRQYVAPDTNLKNRRALKLEGKDLLSEYRWLRDCALTLRDYARNAERVLTREGRTWPVIPRLPTHADRNASQRRRSAPKSRPPQPRPSPR